ncbi:MAG: hypothetical protein ABIR96_01715, partial [Bdellovibrionota bacterium]
QLEEKKDDSSGASLGPFTNLNFGGALDMRLYFPRLGGPTDSHMGFGNFDIHVSELFLTTNIGDHISVLAEQLLVTDPMGSTTGQDHGFVYAIFSSIPGLPESFAIKVGRMRFRFGIDSKLDSPANPLKSPVYKTLGIITDKGVEFSGFAGPLDWSLGVANGVDSIMVPVVTTTGMPAEVMMDTRNGSKPVIARIGFDATDSFALGLSGFAGKTYPVTSHYGFAMHDMLFNGHTDETRLISKTRAALDAKLKLGSRWDLSGEYAFGRDRDNGRNYKVWSGYGRLDYRIVPQKWSAQLQYDYFDDGRDVTFIDGKSYKDSGTMGLGLTYYLTEQAWIRADGMVDDRGLFRSRDGDVHAPEYLGVVQTMLSF